MKSIYKESLWGGLQEEKENGQYEVFTYECENGKITYPYIKRVAGKLIDSVYYDLVTPRGFCGHLIECSTNSKKLVEEFDNKFNQFCIQNNIVAEYVRYDPWEDVSNFFEDVYDIKPYGTLYCNYLSNNFSEEQYSYTRRKNIRKAKRNGINIEFDFCGDSINKFLELYEYTIDKNSVSSYYLLTANIINKYFSILKDKVFIVNAIYDNEIISTTLFLMGEDIIHAHFSGTDPKYKALQANCLIIYETAMYAMSRGIKVFDFGGATPGSSLEKFKKEFVSDKYCYKYCVGTKIRNKDVYDKLVEQSGGPRKNYFPEYRK